MEGCFKVWKEREVESKEYWSLYDFGTHRIVSLSVGATYGVTKIHDVFHVLLLWKYIADPTHVLGTQTIQLKEDLSYKEEPMQILDRKEQVLRTKTIPLVNVLRRNHKGEEPTWEDENQMKIKYPNLFFG